MKKKVYKNDWNRYLLKLTEAFEILATELQFRGCDLEKKCDTGGQRPVDSG